ncbi:NmrA family protein [Planoprotostelium fungivorum]|uniref:NmrA family protein n=1 Tax=Planoprotostelium fungivorum TaxID=1890364 RepID=A0A2P6NPZ0_9EUKA|nr:NmrA family protein [Planoprotostelium fungivorum]
MQETEDTTSVFGGIQSNPRQSHKQEEPHNEQHKQEDHPATGKQGGQVTWVSELLAEDARANFTIRALSRNPESVAARSLAARGRVDTAFLVTLPEMKDHQKEATRGIRFVDEAKKATREHHTKWTIEQHICEVDIPWTILRSVAFMDNFTVHLSKANFVGFGIFATFKVNDHEQKMAVKSTPWNTPSLTPT